MSVWSEIVRKMTRSARFDEELESEARLHMDARAEELERGGLAAEDARVQAGREFGNRLHSTESSQEAWRMLWLEHLGQDLRHGFRRLANHRGFTAAATLTLALGIGANVAIFSVVYGVLLKPLPYKSGDRLVVMHQQARKLSTEAPFSVKEIVDYRENNHTLDAVVEHHTMDFLLLRDNGADRVKTAVVSANFFDVLGVRPAMGRTFVAADEDHGADAVLVLSDQYWRAHHSADPQIVGKVFQMNNRPHTVIGVLPPIPQYPVESDVYMPTSQCPTRSSQGFIENRRARMMTAFGRLKPGVSTERAQSDLALVAAQLERSYPDVYPASAGYAMQIAPLQQELTERARATFLVLLGVAGLVLLIACANVANLLLARLMKLEPELALRMALGATKFRLMRQLVTESLLLAGLGGALGLALAPIALRMLVAFAGRFTTRAAEVQIDAPVLAFAMALSLATGLLFGLGPAFLSSGRVADAIRQAGARASGLRGQRFFRGGLVVAQVAVSFMLLIAAGLALRSFARLQQVNPGFNPNRVLTMRLSTNFSRYTTGAQTRAMYEDLLRRVQAVPGVEGAATASNFPFNKEGIARGPNSRTLRIEGRGANADELTAAVDVVTVSAEYFQVLRQPLAQGRAFTDADTFDKPQVVVVNQTMARRRWPGENPIGKQVSTDAGQRRVVAEVIGVVGDVKDYGLDEAPSDKVYRSALQTGFGPNLLVRTAADPETVVASVRAAIRSVDTQIAIDTVQTIAELEEDSVASPRVTAILLGLFGVLALIISAGGIAAIIALAVTHRTKELGIRLSLGASRSSILYEVMRQGMALTVVGTLVGVAGSVALTRLLAGLLFETSPTDVPTFVAISLVFLAVAAVACFVPARQVTTIDPLRAMRQE